MDDIELARPIPRLAPDRDGRKPYATSRCVVRLHGVPLGLVDVELPPGGAEPEQVAARIDSELRSRIASHLHDDGIAATRVATEGFPAPENPDCEKRREAQLNEAPDVSVVICTRNRPDSVRETLRSILACDFPDAKRELIVVDNASDAESAVRIVASEFDGSTPVRVVREPVPGLSNARNKGVTESSAGIVVFADDDIEVDRGWLRVLTTPFVHDPRVGATSGVTLPGALKTPTERWTEGFGGRASAFEVRVFDLDSPPPDAPLFPFNVGDFGAGRNMAFRRDLLLQLGGFDPALGPGTLAHDGDDIEALLRVLLSGHSIVHDPTAIVWHAHPQDYSELVDRVWGYGVGLTACLTRAVRDHPRLLVDLLLKLPRGIRFALSPKSGKNIGRQADFPSALARRELLGMAYGPIAYARSRRRASRQLGETPPAATPG